MIYFWPGHLLRGVVLAPVCISQSPIAGAFANSIVRYETKPLLG